MRIDITMPFTTPTRRGALALTLAAAAAPMLGTRAFAAPPPINSYRLLPVKVAEGVWVVPGAQDKITAANGGAIANVLILDSSEGVVLVDTGPSYDYGRELDALVRTLTGKPVARIFVTHIHADHSPGRQRFRPEDDLRGRPDSRPTSRRAATTSATRCTASPVISMRGTSVPDLTHVATDGVEQVGGRRFRCLPMSGHTASDLCLYEETSGLLLTGDLVFLDRAPTTPDADLPAWRHSLVPHRRHPPCQAGAGARPGGAGRSRHRADAALARLRRRPGSLRERRAWS